MNIQATEFYPSNDVKERCSFIRMNREERKQNKQHALDKRDMWKAFETHACNNPPHQQKNENVRAHGERRRKGRRNDEKTKYARKKLSS